MSTFVLIIHVLSCVILAAIILMQSGRGGGLTEVFASAESMFGAKTNEMLIRVTTVAAVLFFLTNISLAILNSREGRSLMSDKVVAQTQSNVNDVVKDVAEKVPAAEKAVKEVAEGAAKTE